MAQDPAYDLPTYTPAARKFHWLIALLILIQFPIGLYMTYRGNDMETVNDKGETVKGVWDGVTNTLYSSHKALGLTILALVLLRLIYRLSNGAPRSDPSVPPALTGVAHLVHWSIYLLLLAVPTLGLLGIYFGDYLDIFSIKLPQLVTKDSKFAETLFEYHEVAAFILIALVVLHVGAAIFHHFVRRDRVVERMVPKRIV